MNRATSERFNSGTQPDVTSGNACWETPPAVFAALQAQFHFDVDLTADRQRRLCEAYFGPDHVNEWFRDALTGVWQSQGSRGYSNPPYGPFVQKMLAKAKAEAARGFFSVLLLPMRVTVAFRRHVLDGASQVLLCSRRLTFFDNGVPRLNEEQFKKGKLVGDPAMFDSILVVYDGITTRPTLGEWLVPDHVSKADLERAADRKRKAA
jgi:hypothetical protein